MMSELLCKCDKCGQGFVVIVEYGLEPEETDPELELTSYMDDTQVWYCPNCSSYNTHMNECYEIGERK